jgi:hypothetical protein
MQEVVLNKAAAELEAAAAAAAEQEQAEEDEEAQVEMLDAEAAEEQAEEQQAEEEEQAAPWVPRVVVLGRLHKGISTAEHAGSVIVVRPSHLAAASPAAPAVPAPEVVVLPALARKTPAPSALKQRGARTPAVARNAVKGATPAAAVAAHGKTPAAKGATPVVLALGRTPAAAASAAKSVGVAPELPKSMLKEAPGEGWAACGSSCSRFHCGIQPVPHLSAGPVRWPHVWMDVASCHPPAGTGGAATVVLENVELPGWLFEGEQAAPDVEAAAAVVAAEQQEVASAPAEAPAAADAVQEEDEQQQAVQPAAEEEEEEQEEARMDVDAAAVAQAPQQAPASAAAKHGQQQQQEEAAASDAEEEDEDFCHLCGQSGECAGGQQAGRRCGQQRLLSAAARGTAMGTSITRNSHCCFSLISSQHLPPCSSCLPCLSCPACADEGDILLLCDSCDNACHLSCCTPPLKRVPKGDWFCIDCSVKQAAAQAEAAKAK